MVHVHGARVQRQLEALRRSWLSEHHGAYSRELGVWAACVGEHDGLAYLLVGVECPLEVIWERREATWGQKRGEVDQGVVAAVEQGQVRIHTGLDDDLMVGTSVMSPDECATSILWASNRRRLGIE